MKKLRKFVSESFNNMFSNPTEDLHVSGSTSVSLTLADGATSEGNSSVVISDGEVVKAECFVKERAPVMDESGRATMQVKSTQFTYKSENKIMEGEGDMAEKYVSQVLLNAMRRRKQPVPQCMQRRAEITKTTEEDVD